MSSDKSPSVAENSLIMARLKNLSQASQNSNKEEPRSKSLDFIYRSRSKTEIESFFSSPDEFDRKRFQMSLLSNENEFSKPDHSLWNKEIAETQEEHDAIMNDITQREFLLRHTLSFWVSIMFLLGSCLFIVGGIAEIWKLGPNGRRDSGSFITTPYIVGGFAYTFGCFSGFLAVINLNRKDPLLNNETYHRFRFWAYLPTMGYYSQLFYSIGSLFFNIGTLVSDENLIFITFTIGSIFFTIGASCEVHHNYGFHFRPSRLGWWISWDDLLGSILFLVGSLNGIPTIKELLWEDNERMGSIFLTSLPFIIGSFFFLVSSLSGLWMWKLEQYGNSYLPEINMAKPSKKSNIEGFQVFFVLIYCLNITFSIVNMSMSVRCNKTQLPSQLLRIIIPVGLLALSSVIHMIPEKPPFSYLLWWLRWSMIYQLVVDIIDINNMCKVYDQ